MVRKLILSLSLLATLFANSIEADLRYLIGEQAYSANENKVKKIFSDGSKFIDINGNLNYDKITTALRTNSLLNLSYSSAATIDLSFSSISSATLVIKAITQSLNDLGYNYFLTKNLVISSSGMVWNIIINTQFVLNPGSLYKDLLANNIFIKEIKRTGQFSYSYEIDASSAILKTMEYESDAEVSLSKPLEPYFLNVSGKSSVEIKSKSGDNWVVLVKILDKNLRLISQIKSDKKEKRIYIKLPKDSVYLLIDDAFSLENIKHGLNIYIKSN